MPVCYRPSLYQRGRQVRILPATGKIASLALFDARNDICACHIRIKCYAPFRCVALVFPGNMQYLFRDRQADADGRSLAGLALGGDGSTVGLDQVPGDRQAQPRAA